MGSTLVLRGRRNKKLVLAVPMMKVASPFTGRRLVSLPFYRFCDPLCMQDADLFRSMELINSHARIDGCNYVELRGGRAFLKNEPEWSGYYGHEVFLAGDEDKVYSGLSSDTRRNIRKAETRKG